MRSIVFRPALALLLGLAALPALAQKKGRKSSIPYHPVSFSADKPAELPDSLKSYPALYEFSRFYYEAYSAGGESGMVKTTHRRVRINNETGLNEFKTIEFAADETDGYLDLKVRLFSPSGQTRELDLKNLRTVDENGRKVQKLAIDGLEIGGGFELVLSEPGHSVEEFSAALQSGIPIYRNLLSIRVPDGLDYEIKAYNVKAQQEEKKFDSDNEKEYTLSTGPVMPLKDEEFMDYAAQLGRADIVLRRIPASNYALSWNTIANRMITPLLPANADDRKAILKFLKKIKADGKPPLIQVSMLESWLKQNVVIRDGFAQQAFQTVVEKDKQAYEFALLRFYVNLLDYHQIAYRIGATSERNTRLFDPEIPSYSSIGTWFLYLPDTKQYLFPGVPAFLLGNTYAGVIGQKGIFIKPLVVNGAVGVKVSIDSVGLPDTVSNIHNTVARMKVNLEDGSATASVRNVMAGYTAVLYRSGFQGMSPKELADNIKQSTFEEGGEGTISDVKLENLTYDGSQPNLPFVEDFQARQPNAVEKVGDELLVNVGWVIGRQVSLPKSEPRRYPVNPGPPKVYNRDIVLEIPAGYKVAGLKDFDKSISHDKGNMVFDLKVTQEGNTLRIRNKEYYREAVMPPNQFTHYEEVMNAAALLNNLKLVFRKG